MVALFMVTLLGVGALAVDIGRGFVVRNELQNAADAAALAGTRSLLSTTGAPGASYLSPNWGQASLDSNSAVGLNAANGVVLANGQVVTGYWNVKRSPSGIQAPPMTPGAYDKPAIRVTVSKSAGQNGGPLMTYLAPILGISKLDVSASAVAIISAPGYAKPSAIFPMAITQCLYTNYWDAANGRPKIDPGTGKPYVFDIGSAYHYAGCSSGQWTSFQTDVNDVPSIRNLIANGNPTPLALGDSIWIQPGTKNTVYSSVVVPSDVLVPVVVALDTHSFVPIVAYAPFHISGSVGGSGKYVQGNFVAGYVAPGTSPGAGDGTYYGAVTPGILAQ